MKRCLFVVLMLCVSTTLHSQQRRPQPSVYLYGDLVRLQSLTSVLYIAAHPDDENTRLLSWLARGKHVRTAYLSLTRGDGGQNILGSELGSALGLIRTHELLAARELDGAGQYFTRALDFGFSKTARETFVHWDSARLVNDVQQVFAAFRPDVVICRFPASRMAGHGQHEASAIIARAAYQQCPESLRPHRLLFNAYRFGDRSTIAEGQFALQVGQYDPLIGMGYGELAGRSRSLHKSQGAGTPSTPGMQPEYFETLEGEPPTKSLFDGIDTTWSRVGRPDIAEALQEVIDQFYLKAPSAFVEELLRIRSMIAVVRDPFWRDLKLGEIDAVITSAIGLTADCSVPQALVVGGDTTTATLRVVVRAPACEIRRIEVPGVDDTAPQALTNDVLWTKRIPLTIPSSTTATNPYWLDADPVDGQFTLRNEALLGLPATPPELTCRVTLAIDGEPLTITLPLSYKRLDPIKGDVIEELRVVPPVSVEPLSELVMQQGTNAQISVRLRAYTAVNNASVILRTKDGERVVSTGLQLAASTDTLVTIPVRVASTQTVEIGVRSGAQTFDRTVRVITYDHLPTLQYLEPARVRVVADTIRVTAKRIAFVEGAGEQTPDVLRGLGVIVEPISTETVLQTDTLLATYDAVLVGIRALNTRKDMKYVMPALMTYVERGGTVVLQYNTTGDLSTTTIGPFPMKITRDRVTEEDAAVTLLLPQHPLLTTPNQITAADFTGWQQERGLYFTGEHDARYQRVLSMYDVDEEPREGALVYAPYGRGHYVYCALSLFRNVPAGVPGAIKLLANMISVGQ